VGRVFRRLRGLHGPRLNSSFKQGRAVPPGELHQANSSAPAGVNIFVVV